MPWGKKAAVGLAILAGLVAFTDGALALVRQHVASGLLMLVATFIIAVVILHTYWVRWDLSRASLRSGPPEMRQVALTFDDGPGPDTLAVLDALDVAAVRATFFVLGRAAEERPAVVREIARRGHLVAQHGYSHRKLHFALPRTIDHELRGGCRAIRAAGIEPAPFFRAPHGFKGPVLSRALRRSGLTLVGWTRGVWDTERPGVEAIVERACDGMRGGEILLLHDGCGTPGIDPRRDQTAGAVVEIVRRWKASGFDFVTIDRLVGDRADESVAGLAPRATMSSSPQAPLAAEAPGTVVVPGTDPATARAPSAATAGRLGRAFRWAGIAALLGLTVAAARKLDPSEIMRALSQASPPLLCAAAAANVLALAMQSGRWLAIVHPIEPRAKPRDAFFALVAGYAVGLVVPARASDLARAHLMARRSGASMTTLAATALIDHLLGSVALFAALGLFAAFSSLPGWIRTAGMIACGAAVTALVALWFLRPREVRRVPGTGVSAFVARLRQGLLAVGRPRAVALSLMFATAGWSAEVAIAHLSLAAFGLPSGIAPALLVVLATTLSSAASLSPGNAGAFEVACVIALSGVGVPREPAFAFALGYHAVHLVPTGILGGGWLLAHGYRAGVLREVP